MADEMPHPIKYMSFGSPLMDCIADVSKEFIDNNKIELNTTTHKKLKEIKFLNEFLTKKKLHISQEDVNSMQCVFLIGC